MLDWTRQTQLGSGSKHLGEDMRHSLQCATYSVTWELCEAVRTLFVEGRRNFVVSCKLSQKGETASHGRQVHYISAMNSDAKASEKHSEPLSNCCWVVSKQSFKIIWIRDRKQTMLRPTHVHHRIVCMIHDIIIKEFKANGACSVGNLALGL